MVDRLKGKVAVVTGAGTGIGLATAQRFHAEGARVVLAGRSDTVETAANELGDGAVAIRADVANAADAQKIIDLAISEFGGLDVLANVAGANPDPVVSFVEETEEAFDLMVDVNLRGVYNTMKAALPHFLERGAGSIVNVSSTAALFGAPSLSSYSAAKTGVLGMTRSVALEVAAQGVRANTLCPGAIKTPMFDRGVASNPEMADYLIDMIPLRRVGMPEQVADAMLFLASDESSYVTGIALPVDGGQNAT